MRQHSLARIRQFPSSSEGVPQRRSQSSLVESRASVRVFSLLEARDRGLEELQSLFQGGSDSDCSHEDGGVVVTGTERVKQVTDSSESSAAVESAGSRAGRSVSPEHSVPVTACLAPLTASRVEVLTNVYVAQGHDPQVASMMAMPQRNTSIAVYENHWRRFAKWLLSQAVAVHDVTSAVFTRYLHSLFISGLSVSTVKSHRSAISPIVRSVSGYDPSVDRGVTDLCRRFAIERPRLQRVFPEWNLEVVLRRFLEPPFVGRDRTDRSILLEHLTVKTVFFTSLATGRRVSCLHGLSHDFVIHKGDVEGQQVVVLRTLPEFRSKAQRPSEVPRPITIPGSAHLVPDDPERFLCPVRCLRLYMSRTVDRHRLSRRLFVHWNPDLSDIKVTHISRWIVKCITDAYAKEGLDMPDQVRAHELRALAGSWAHWSGISVEDIKQSLCWKSSGVFQNSYLRNLSEVADGLHRLSPLVAAGALVQ